MAKKQPKRSTKSYKSSVSSKASSANVALVYLPLVGWIPAAVFMLTETDHKVRWHAMQSLLFNCLAMVLFLVSVGSLLGVVVGVLAIVMQVVLTTRAHNGVPMRLPVLADLADNIVRKI